MKKKRFLSLILSLCMVFTICLPATAASSYSFSGKCGANVTWSCNDMVKGIVTISGTGDMYDYTYSDWLNNKIWGDLPRTLIKKVVINEGVTSVGDYAFYKCDTNLTDVSLPDSLKKIGEYSFSHCKYLQSVDFPKNLSQIEKNAFEYCTDLNAVSFQNNVKSIEDSAFWKCNNLSKVSISNLKNWCEINFGMMGGNPAYSSKGNLYYNENKVTSLKIPNDVTKINKYAFYYFSDIQEITIPKNVTSIDKLVFNENTTLNVYKNSYAHNYAIENNYSYTLLDGKEFTGLTFSNATYSYDSKEKEIKITGDLPTGANVVYSNNKGTNTGTYNATAKVTCEGYEDLTLNATLKINPAEISVKANDIEMIKGASIPTLTYTADDLCDGDSFTGTLSTKADGKSVGTFDITQGTLSAGGNYKINFTKDTLTVSDKTLQSATVSAMPEKTYGDEGFKVEVTNDKNSDLGKFTFESSNTNVATIDENGNVTIKNAGDTNIIVKRSGNDTYADFEKSQKLTVKKVAITVNAEAKSKRVGTDDPALTYKYTGTLVEPDKFTGELKRTEGETVGKYDILQNTLKINDNYDITYNKATFEILDKTPQTITVADFSEKTYGDEAFKVIVTPDATSNLSNFTYVSDNENVAKISADGTITIVGAGEANITVTEAGNADYAQATVTKKLTVAKKALEIKVDNIEITYGAEINPNISYNGFITGEDETVLTKPVAVSGYSAKPNVGTYTITLSGAEAANYEISYTGATLTVNKKNITVTVLKVFDKAADETTNATINTSSLVFEGMILGDDVSIDLENAVAVFESATVGNDIKVNITGLALTGADAGNYNLTNNEISTTANIKDSITAADIATQINAASVATDSTEVKLPNVPAGYKIVVKSSDNEDVIKADGTVAPVESNTDVKLTFSIVNENDETDVAETGEITVTVPASTKVKVDVTAEANGTVTGSGEYLKNSEVTVVATPNSGYKFDGWYNGDTSVSTSASYTFKVESDITLVAKFSRKSTGGGGGGGSSISTYTVKFETNGGSTIDSVKVDKNKTVAEPTAPTKDGFDFAGWYTDKALTTKYDFSEKVTKGITLYAAWTEKKAEVKDDNTEPTEPTTPENKITFTDVKENDWFAENVKYVFENGLMNGTTDTEFAPDDNLTRAMLVTILYRAESEPEVNKSIPFADVTADSYYANAVIWAQQNGIVSGVNENEFAPDENITREQIATIIYRYANYKGYDTSAKADISSFTDADEISDYATEAMQYAVGSGLIKGKTETTLNPQDNATRAEIAAILQRFIEVNK